ncbi:MAG: protein jag [Clostridia bacterium]|nr:protein jag [Clostridia bacterium]
MSNSLRKITKSGKSIEEALSLALEELGVSEDEVTYTVIEEASKGFLGLGSKDAVIEVELKNSVEGGNVAEKFLEDVFEAMGMQVEITSTRDDESLNIQLEGEDMGIIIGKRGDTLDSLQYLTSLVANKGKSRDEYTRITIDTEGYRKKREESLKALSERLANKVAKSGKKYTLEPMNPYERRIIHANLQSNENVTTFSVGEEPYRKVVIAPKNERRRPSYNKKPVVKKEYNYPVDEDLPTTYPGGGQVTKAKVSSFEEYLAEHEND